MIFISYAREDEDKVRSIADAIRFRTDYELWRDNQIRAGQQFNLAITRALKDANAAVVFWSKHSVESEFVIDEASRAKDAGKLIPVKIEDCDPPAGFRNLETIDVTKFVDVPPYGDSGLSLLIFELNRFEKLPRDILTVFLSKDQTDQYEIMRRITGGLHAFVGMNSREAIAGMPFVTGLQLVGFTTYLGLEPGEYSGAEVKPILEEVDRAQLVILTFFPSLLVRSNFYEMLIRRSGEKPVFILMFGPLTEEELAESYNFISSIPRNRIIRRDSVGFPSAKSAKKTWELLRNFIRSVEVKNTPP